MPSTHARGSLHLSLPCLHHEVLQPCPAPPWGFRLMPPFAQSFGHSKRALRRRLLVFSTCMFSMSIVGWCVNTEARKCLFCKKEGSGGG